MPSNKIKAYGILLYKIEEDSIKVLLCKSVKSLEKWGCLKGMQQRHETDKQCARREFFEECSIKVDLEDFEDYFYQENELKDVGIWLVNASKVKDIDTYFNDNGKLHEGNLSWENSKVKFFDLKKLPKIKRKQKILMKEIKDFLQSKNQFH